MHKCLLGTHSNEDNWGRVSVQFDSSSKYWAQYSDHLSLFIYCNISSCHLVKHVQPYVNLWMDASGAPPTPWIFLNGPSPPPWAFHFVEIFHLPHSLYILFISSKRLEYSDKMNIFTRLWSISETSTHAQLAITLLYILLANISMCYQLEAYVKDTSW